MLEDLDLYVSRLANLQLQHTYVVHTGTHSTCLCTCGHSEHAILLALKGETGLNLPEFASLHSLTVHFQIM